MSWTTAGSQRDRSKLLATLASVVFGPKIRFLAGAVLLAGCIVWMHQNAMISQEHAQALVEAAKSGDLDCRTNARSLRRSPCEGKSRDADQAP